MRLYFLKLVGVFVTACHAVPAVADSRAVQIEVAGTLPSRCATSASTLAFHVQSLDKAGGDSQAFDIDCNAPFEYRLTSQNGGLTLDAASASAFAPNFASQVPYTLAVHIPLDGGHSLDAACPSAQLKRGAVACPFQDSGQFVAIRKSGRVSISWAASAKPLAPGAYQDILTMSVSVRP